MLGDTSPKLVVVSQRDSVAKAHTNHTRPFLFFRSPLDPARFAKIVKNFYPELIRLGI